VSVDRLNRAESSDSRPYSSGRTYEAVNQNRRILKISIDGERSGRVQEEGSESKESDKKMSTSISDLLSNYEQISSKSNNNNGSFTKPYQNLNQKSLYNNVAPVG
jgi:hypothetical protein